MNLLKAVLVVQLATMMFWSSPKAWSQDEEMDIGDEIEASETTEEELSFDEMDETKSTDKKAEATEESGEEMTLEPLQGDEDQVTDVPADPKKPEEAPVEETPPELTPPPPSNVAEPEPQITPEPMMSSDDTPDLAFEAKMHDIYLNYHSKKLSDDEWTQLLGSRESESYTIQSGDTLWSVSKTFFNDGNYWPKIWQLNSAITNPHLIQPGNTIRFLLGTESETPAFAVTEASDEPVDMPVGDAGAAGIEEPQAPLPKMAGGKSARGTPTDEIEIPAPSEEFKPVLKRVPPSLPEWSLQRRGESYDDSGVDYGRRRILDLPDKKYLESFVDREDFKVDGEISEIEGGATTAANYQYVFIKLPAGQGKTGDNYTIIQRSGQLPRVSEEVATTRRDMGYQFRVQGQARLEDLLSTASDGQDIFRALIVKSLSQISKGSSVTRGTLPTLSLNPNGEKSDIMTQIVGAHQIDGQKTLSLHSLAFLSGGEAQGLKEGQILTVRANTRVRNSKSILAESYIPVGLLKVVKVGEKFTTAIVLKVWDAIFVGDVTGDGKVVPPTPPERKTSDKVTAKAPAPKAEEIESDEIEEDFDIPDDETTEDFDQIED